MISVCIPTYNGENYIEQQILSILSQLKENDEIIISDDSSTDKTLNIINSINDKRIKVIHHLKNKQHFPFSYTTSNIENALRYAKGDYIFLCDQDDVWLKNKIELFLQSFNKYNIILSDCSITDYDLNILVHSKMKFENVHTGILRNLYKCGYLGCCMAFKKELLKYILPIPHTVPHDLWIGIIGKYYGNFGIIQQPTMLYRRHDKNVSSTNNKLIKKQKKDATITMKKNENSFSYRFSYRLYTLLHFLNRIITSSKNITNI